MKETDDVPDIGCHSREYWLARADKWRREERRVEAAAWGLAILPAIVSFGLLSLAAVDAGRGDWWLAAWQAGWGLANAWYVPRWWRYAIRLVWENREWQLDFRHKAREFPTRADLNLMRHGIVPLHYAKDRIRFHPDRPERGRLAEHRR